jgi:hypothetical protein
MFSAVQYGERERTMQNYKSLSLIKATRRANSFVFGVALVAATFSSSAIAGCGSYDPGTKSFYSQNSPSAGAQETLSDDRHPSGSQSIVGMWKVTFTATDGSGYSDFGYSQWHVDGTEFLNSGSRAPSTQNFCLGVWEQTGKSNYKLNHFALSYDAVSGTLNGKVRIMEKVSLGASGDAYSGTFLIQVFDPTGTTEVAHFEGKVSATRVTVDTSTP